MLENDDMYDMGVTMCSAGVVLVVLLPIGLAVSLLIVSFL
jgi:hypothetical protein